MFIDTEGKERAVLAVIAALVIAVGFLGSLLLMDDDSDSTDTPVAPTREVAQNVPTGGTPVAPAREGFVPDGCWPPAARSTPNPEAENVFLFPQWATAPEMVIDEDATYTATFATNKGEMTFALDPEAAPETVNNFVCLATSGFYDTVPFHRVIQGFMVQSGDPTGTGSGGPGYRFGDELPPEDRAYTRGTLAMANAGPDTQGSQFFIVHEDLGDDFPRNYSIFGELTAGEGVLDEIADTTVVPHIQGEQSRPVEFVVIERIILQENGD